MHEESFKGKDWLTTLSRRHKMSKGIAVKSDTLQKKKTKTYKPDFFLSLQWSLLTATQDGKRQNQMDSGRERPSSKEMENRRPHNINSDRCWLDKSTWAFLWKQIKWQLRLRRLIGCLSLMFPPRENCSSSWRCYVKKHVFLCHERSDDIR